MRARRTEEGTGTLNAAPAAVLRPTATPLGWASPEGWFWRGSGRPAGVWVAVGPGHGVNKGENTGSTRPGRHVYSGAAAVLWPAGRRRTPSRPPEERIGLTGVLRALGDGPGRRQG
jgi:hypothetical protein